MDPQIVDPKPRSYVLEPVKNTLFGLAILSLVVGQPIIIWLRLPLDYWYVISGLIALALLVSR